MSQNQPNPPTLDPQESNLRTEADTHGGDHPDQVAQPARSDVADQPGGNKKPDGPEYYDDPRDAIEADIDARRLSDDAAVFEDWTNPKERWGQDKVITSRRDKDRDNPPPPALTEDTRPPTDQFGNPINYDAQPAPAAPAPRPDQNTRQRQDGSTEYRLVVDGQELWQTPQEMVGAAQKGLHADKELNETKRLQRELQDTLSEVRRVRDDIKSGAPADRAPTTPDKPAAPDGRPTPTPAADDDASWAELADKVQYGTKAEAAAALKSLRADRPADQQLTPEVLRQTFRSVAREEQYDSDAEKSMTAFMDANTGIKEDRYLSTAVLMATHDVMREDVARLVYEDQKNNGWDMARAAELADKMTGEQVEKAHKAFATQGYTVRQPSRLIEDAQKRLPWLSQRPTPQPPGNGQGNGGGSQFPVPRSQRQDALPVNPAQRNSPPPTNSQPQPGRPQSNAEILAEERAARGLPY